MASSLRLLVLVFGCVALSLQLWLVGRAPPILPVAEAMRAVPHRGAAVVHNPEQRTVQIGAARFTVLTAAVIRMEWAAEDAEFVDEPSLVFLHRSDALAHAVDHTVTEAGGVLVIQTAELVLRYDVAAPHFFESPGSLNVSLRVGAAQTEVTWYPKQPERGNLGGTVRTLDRANGPVRLEPGLLSTSGWHVVDDSAGPLLEDPAGDKIPWVRARNRAGSLDLYFFGHGLRYRQALADYVLLSGRMPLPPRHVFGVWWSRWWPYSDSDLVALVSEHDEHNMPLDNLVIDMDWHLTDYDAMDEGSVDLAGQPIKWTGYTWDPRYFPEPSKFLRWCHDRGLHVTLNLHPASGVQPHEARYKDMLAAMGGAEAAPNGYVPFAIDNEKYGTALFDAVLRPLEHDGVDFWWLDWQFVDTTNTPGLNPTIWLNHVFFLDRERRRAPLGGLHERGLILHRWGGLGSHRYQIGFSGDVVSSWESLDFQIFFTARAANVAFGFWSHDIGGFMSRMPTPPELMARWVQWGALSPVYRTHATRAAYIERRIWRYGRSLFSAMLAAVHLRMQLAPYIYAEARAAHDTGVAIVAPVYLDFPEMREAYAYGSQYFFGADLFVAPVTQAAESVIGAAEKSMWVPPGLWYEWATGRSLDGPAELLRTYTIEQIPVFLRAGAVVPMVAEPGRTVEQHWANGTMCLVIFLGSGAAGRTGQRRLYDDDGWSTEYATNSSTKWRRVSHGPSLAETGGGEAWELALAATEGEREISSSAERPWRICLHGVGVPVGVTVTISKAGPAGGSVEIEAVYTPGLLVGPALVTEWALAGGKTYNDSAKPAEAPAWAFDGERSVVDVALGRLRESDSVVVRVVWAARAESAKAAGAMFGTLSALKQARESLVLNAAECIDGHHFENHQSPFGARHNDAEELYYGYPIFEDGSSGPAATMPPATQAPRARPEKLAALLAEADRLSQLGWRLSQEVRPGDSEQRVVETAQRLHSGIADALDLTTTLAEQADMDCLKPALRVAAAFFRRALDMQRST